ncbi:MAG: hypothetical protein H0T79_03290 [Deltaproteobacteria bacterium]|nr:hypothetical protein [Deltaproteobacteria bacterium]
MATVIETATHAEAAWPVFRGGRVRRIAGLLGLIGAIVFVIGLVLDPTRAMYAYLTAYVTVAAVAIGVLILALAQYATNAHWPAAVRRLQEAVIGVFPLLVVLFVPIAIGLDYLYVWADPTATVSAHDHHKIAAKGAWLSTAGFVLRAVLYLGIFTLVAELLRRWSRRRDLVIPAADAPPVEAPIVVVEGEAALRRERRFASAMLPAVGLATTFAAFDWIMSLQPAWFSTIFGVYYFAGGFGAGIAVVAILAWRARVTGVSRAAITPHHFHALGRLLFAFVVFWAYAAYFQGFIIRIADRPDEVTFYILRLQHGWDIVLWLLLIVHFAVPFLLLLPRRLKLRPRYVAAVAGIVLLGHVLDMYWLVMPVAGSPVSWIDFAAFAFVVGACVLAIAWRQRGLPMVATGDPNLSTGIQYVSPT